MRPDRVSNPGPVTYESGALPTYEYLNKCFHLILDCLMSCIVKDLVRYKELMINFRISVRREIY